MIYETANVFTCFVESLVTIMLFNAFLTQRERFPKWTAVFSVFLLAAAIFTSNMLLRFTLSNALITMLLSFAISFVYTGDFRTRVLLSFLSVLLSGTIEILVLFLMMFVTGLSSDEIVNETPLRLLGIILSKLLLFITTNFICIKRKKHLSKLPVNYWILFIVELIGVLLEVFYIFKFRYSGSEKLLDVLSVFVAVFILFVFFLTLYLYEHMSEQAEELTHQKLLKQQLDSQVKHVNEIILTQKQLKKVRHDLSNHIIVCKKYIDEGEYDKCADYIDKLTESIIVNSDVINTGNVVIDAILSAKKSSAQKGNIDFKYEIKVPENLEFDSVDMCILLGNALDNAIEACEKIDNDKYIDVSLLYKENMLICKIENSAPPKEGDFLKTTKKNPTEHGIGLSNIRSVLDKYKSTLKIDYDANIFTLTFIIFI